MILASLQPGPIAHVAYNMRARDREELAALGMVFSWMPTRASGDVPLPQPGAHGPADNGEAGLGSGMEQCGAQAPHEKRAGYHETHHFALTTSQLAERLALARYGFVACADDCTPIAVCAGNEHLPGLVGWSFFATARLNEIGLALTRYLRFPRPAP